MNKTQNNYKNYILKHFPKYNSEFLKQNKSYLRRSFTNYSNLTNMKTEELYTQVEIDIISDQLKTQYLLEDQEQEEKLKELTKSHFRIYGGTQCIECLKDHDPLVFTCCGIDHIFQASQIVNKVCTITLLSTKTTPLPPILC